MSLYYCNCVHSQEMHDRMPRKPSAKKWRWLAAAAFGLGVSVGLICAYIMVGVS